MEVTAEFVLAMRAVMQVVVAESLDRIAEEIKYQPSVTRPIKREAERLREEARE